MRTIVVIASISLIAIMLSLSTTSLAMAQVTPTCPTSISTTLSWVSEAAIDGDPDINANGFVCVLNYTESSIPRITIDDL